MFSNLTSLYSTLLQLSMVDMVVDDYQLMMTQNRKSVFFFMIILKWSAYANARHETVARKSMCVLYHRDQFITAKYLHLRLNISRLRR